MPYASVRLIDWDEKAENNGVRTDGIWAGRGGAATLRKGQLTRAHRWGGASVLRGRVVMFLWLVRSGMHVAMLTYHNGSGWLEHCGKIVPLDRSTGPPKLRLAVAAHDADDRLRAKDDRAREANGHAPDRARSPEMSSGGVQCRAHGVLFCPSSRRARRAARDPRRPWRAGGGRAGAGMEACRARARVEGTARNGTILPGMAGRARGRSG